MQISVCCCFNSGNVTNDTGKKLHNAHKHITWIEDVYFTVHKFFTLHRIVFFILQTYIQVRYHDDALLKGDIYLCWAVKISRIYSDVCQFVVQHLLCLASS